ncbi:MAG: 3-isopropylmalate dehydratase small subunit [Alphaproteobacteria bacterium]|nr:3-isopropylmalate dehydratase small subunit [Alphaproteobacteria bacterium]
MHPFKTLTAIAAPMPIDNIDTDMIIPKQFLKTIKRTGLKEGLFFEMRFRVDGSKVEEFVLHNAPYDRAEIIVAGSNFGCGSSREHAPWALLDFGIRCVIATSYADIFYNNCFKNGILPIVLPKDAVDSLMQIAENGQTISVDLPSQKVKAGNHEFAFEVESFRKHCLLNGLDDIGLSLQKTDAIAAFETKNKTQTPWLYANAS